jgi:hypothetical protein
VATEQPPGPLEHGLEVHGGEDRLDGLLDDAAVDVVLRRRERCERRLRFEDRQSGANHGPVSTEISVPDATGDGCRRARALEKGRDFINVDIGKHLALGHARASPRRRSRREKGK